MRIRGRERVELPLEEVWRRINDPEVLRRCTPGLETLEQTRPDHFEAVLVLELPAIKGRFAGSVDYLERSAPARLRLRLQGKGPIGFVRGEATLELRAEHQATQVHYIADVQLGGQIARLGQRMISGMVKEMAGQFFEALGGSAGAQGAPPGAPPAPRALLRLAWRTILNLLGLSRRS
ncbi:MAG: carbon monoxide dehydrogenase subunit G [Acidobacteriota bacterium]